MAWTDAAKMVVVSVLALRKWRIAGGVSGENHRRLAELLAFIRVLHEVGIKEPAGWISIPMVDGYTVVPMHLYGSIAAPMLLEVGSSSISPITALDELSPGWRQEYETDFEVKTAFDGQQKAKRWLTSLSLLSSRRTL